MLRIEIWEKTWPMREPFAIARGVQTTQPTLQVRLTDDAGCVGRGEACGVNYAGETVASMTRQIEGVVETINGGIDRDGLLSLLPAGGARLALDAALWDLEAKRSGIDPFAVAGWPAAPVLSAYTIGIRDIDGYRAAARSFRSFPLLKVKVDGSDPLAALAAVHEGAPNARIIVDPNQSWNVNALKAIAPHLRSLNVIMIEQPVKVGDEVDLDDHDWPVPLCADELINDIDDLVKAKGRFQYINIKLDKAGGLTASLALAAAARAQGFSLMVGCMAGSSLSMAPAMVLAQQCEIADLDGPLLQSEDWPDGFSYVDGTVHHPLKPSLWG